MDRRLERIEILDRESPHPSSSTDFLHTRRYRLRNHYQGGGVSPPYPCEVVSRRHPDAVAVVLFEVQEGQVLRVALRTAPRPAVWLRRRRKDLPLPEERDLLLLAEIVAGLLEEPDLGVVGIDRRAAVECREEAGLDLDPTAMEPLGGSLFPSPGISDEGVYFRAARADLARARPAAGDGSPMEEGGGLLLLSVEEALHRCRSGEIPDAKTEIALLRLCDHVGYSAQLGCFLDALPPHLRPAPQRLRWLMGAEPPPAGPS